MWLVSYVPGRPLEGETPQPGLARALGRSLAQLDAALSDFEHPGQSQVLLWDMQRASELRGLMRHVDDADLRAVVAAWSAARTSADALAALDAASIPSAPVWSLDQAAESDHVRARGLVVDGHHGGMGTVPLVPQPVRFDSPGIATAAVTPQLGEHTRDVLRQVLDMDDDAIEALEKKGAIGR